MIVGLWLIPLADQPRSDLPPLFALTDPLPSGVDLDGLRDLDCVVANATAACRAIRIYDRRTRIDLGHAHSRVAYRFELLLYWACASGEQLRLVLRGQFLVEHVHLDLFAAEARSLPQMLPARDLLRLRRAPPNHQSSFLMQADTNTVLPNLTRLTGLQVSERRAGPGYIAQGYPTETASPADIAGHLGCEAA